MNLNNLDIFMKCGIFMLILSIICRIATLVFYSVLEYEAYRVDRTRNRIVKECCDRILGQLTSGVYNKRVSLVVDRCIRKTRIGIVPITFLPHSGLYCIFLGLLILGIGAYRRIVDGNFILETIPFYVLTIIAVYLYLFVASLTDVSGKQNRVRELLTEYFEEAKEVHFTGREIPIYAKEENSVGNITKKARNKDMEKLLKEFLS